VCQEGPRRRRVRLEGVTPTGSDGGRQIYESLHTFGMPGKWYADLFDIAADQYGFVTPDDIDGLGGRDQVLVDMERHGHLDRVARGLYPFRSFPTTARDELMAATLWPRRLGVISHDSALDLWDLCDVNAAKIHITIPRTARTQRRLHGSLDGGLARFGLLSHVAKARTIVGVGHGGFQCPGRRTVATSVEHEVRGGLIQTPSCMEAVKRPSSVTLL
jgi:hypothetical protein